jgi:hypothetical protein
MIFARNLYYAQPGSADEVLSHRQHACDVREKLGLPRGQVLRRVRGSDELADVVWQCEFADVAEYDRDMDALAASDEFAAVREHMRTLIRHFERVLWEVQ